MLPHGDWNLSVLSLSLLFLFSKAHLWILCWEKSLGDEQNLLRKCQLKGVRSRLRLKGGGEFIPTPLILALLWRSLHFGVINAKTNPIPKCSFVHMPNFSHHLEFLTQIGGWIRNHNWWHRCTGTCRLWSQYIEFIWIGFCLNWKKKNIKPLISFIRCPVLSKECSRWIRGEEECGSSCPLGGQRFTRREYSSLNLMGSCQWKLIYCELICFINLPVKSTVVQCCNGSAEPEQNANFNLFNCYFVIPFK